MRLALALTLLAAPAAADVFDDAAGLWGVVGDPELTCEANPHRVTFDDPRARAFFTWAEDMTNYLGETDRVGAYAVTDHAADRITLSLDGEQRTDHNGEPVVWVMRILDGGARYCWGRLDWPPDYCEGEYVRCTDPPPVS